MSDPNIFPPTPEDSPPPSTGGGVPDTRNPFEYVSPFCSAGPDVDLDVFPSEFPICTDVEELNRIEPIQQPLPAEIIPPGDYCIEFIEDYEFVTDPEILEPHLTGELTPRRDEERYTVDGVLDFEGTRVRNISEDPCAPVFEADIDLDLDLDIPCIGFEIDKGTSSIKLEPIEDPVFKFDIVQGEAPGGVATEDLDVCNLAYDFDIELPCIGFDITKGEVVTELQPVDEVTFKFDIVQGSTQGGTSVPDLDVCNLAYDFDLEIPCIGFDIEKGYVTITDDTELEDPEVTLNILQGDIVAGEAAPNDEVCNMAFNLDIKLPPYLKASDNIGTERIIAVATSQHSCSNYTVQEVEIINGQLALLPSGRIWADIPVDGEPHLNYDPIDVIETVDDEDVTTTSGICAIRTAQLKVTRATYNNTEEHWEIVGDEVTSDPNMPEASLRQWASSYTGPVIGTRPVQRGRVISVRQDAPFCGPWTTTDTTPLSGVRTTSAMSFSDILGYAYKCTADIYENTTSLSLPIHNAPTYVPVKYRDYGDIPQFFRAGTVEYTTEDNIFILTPRHEGVCTIVSGDGNGYQATMIVGGFNLGTVTVYANTIGFGSLVAGQPFEARFKHDDNSSYGRWTINPSTFGTADSGFL